MFFTYHLKKVNNYPSKPQPHKPHFCRPRAGLGFEERLGAVVGSPEVPPALKVPPPSARAREAILLPAARLTLLSGIKNL